MDVLELKSCDGRGAVEKEWLTMTTVLYRNAVSNDSRVY